MPAIPYIAGALDKRTLDSRQLRDLTVRHARTLATRASKLFERNFRLQTRTGHCPSGIIADCYAGETSGPAPGAVVGIVIGSVAGFLLLLWVLWILSQGTDFIRTTALEEEEVVVRRPARSRRSRHSAPREVRERERIYREERITRDRTPSRPPPLRESGGRVHETIIVEGYPEQRVENDDIVEVIEEHSSISGTMPPPPRGSRSRRSSGMR